MRFHALSGSVSDVRKVWTMAFNGNMAHAGMHGAGFSFKAFKSFQPVTNYISLCAPMTRSPPATDLSPQRANHSFGPGIHRAGSQQLEDCHHYLVVESVVVAPVVVDAPASSLCLGGVMVVRKQKPLILFKSRPLSSHVLLITLDGGLRKPVADLRREVGFDSQGGSTAQLLLPPPALSARTSTASDHACSGPIQHHRVN